MSVLFSSDAEFPDFLGVFFNPDMENFSTELPLEPKIKTEVTYEPQSVCGNLAVQTPSAVSSAVAPTIKTEVEDCPRLQENASLRNTQTLDFSASLPPSAGVTTVPNGYIRIKQETPDIQQNASTEECYGNAEERDSLEPPATVETKKYNCKASGCPFKTDIFHLFRRHRVYHQVFHKFKGHLKCSYCSFCCNTQTTLTWHLFQHIDAQNNCRPGSSDSSRTCFFECQYCFMKCDSRRQLSLHLKMHKKNMEMKDKTNRTRKKDWKSKLKKYIASCLKSVPGSKKNYYQCPECPYKAKVKNRLWFIIHFIQHMTMAGEECSLCTYKSTILGIKSHLLVHLRKKPMLKCCSCHFRFRADCDLYQHVRQEHNIDLRKLKVLLIRETIATSDKSQGTEDTELPVEECALPEKVLEEHLEETISTPIEPEPIVCNSTYLNTDSITHEDKTEPFCDQTEQPEEIPIASKIEQEISLEVENITESCSSGPFTPNLDVEEEVDTIHAVIFDDKYYDTPDDSTLTLLISAHQTTNTFNPFRHLETRFSTSCYIFNNPIDEEVMPEDKLEISSEELARFSSEEPSAKNEVVTNQLDSVPSITITITGNTNNAELLQTTVMTEILKSLEFSKLQSNNDENGNLDLDKVSEKDLVNVEPVCEESIDENCFSSSINVNEIEMNYVDQNDQNYADEIFSSAFNEQKPHDDSSNEELSDVPKETDLLFEDIVGKLMEDPKVVGETTSKRTLDVEITNSISETNKIPLSKSLETLSYDDLINYNESHETCLDFFQGQEQCGFESGDDSLRRLEEIRFKIPTPDHSPENVDLKVESKNISLNAFDIEVSKISDSVILYDYTKHKKASSPTCSVVENYRLDNHQSSNLMKNSSVNIQDMEVVFDVPVENDSNEIKRHLQNTLNSKAIEFFVIPNDDDVDSVGSREKSPKQVDFEEVARVPAVLELIGATCEVRTNKDQDRLLENGVTNLDHDEMEDNYSNGSDESTNFNERAATTTLIQNGKVIMDASKSSVKTIFSCMHCPVRFSNDIQLKLHQHLHKSKLGVKCPFCTYRANKTIILKHLLFHAAQTDTVFKCPLCGTKKRNIAFLLDHLKVDHSKEIFRTHDLHCKKKSYQLCNGVCGS